MFLLFFLIITGYFLVNHIRIRCSRYGSLINKIPGLYDYPMIGNLLAFNVSSPDDLWLTIRKVTKQYLPLTRFWSVNYALISISNPEDAEVLLTSSKVIQKGFIYDYLQPWLKTGLLTSTGEKWHNRRRLLTPAFHFNILKRYQEIMNEESQKSVEQLKSEGDYTVKSLVPFSSEYTLNVVCEAALGVSLDNLDIKEMDAYKKAIHDFGAVVIYRIPRPYIYDWMVKFWWKIGKQQTNAVKVLHDFSKKVLKERREYHRRHNNKYLTSLENMDEDDIYGGKRQKLAMLDLLLQSEQNGLIDEEGILEEIDTFTFEGHDTTGMALAYTFLLLAENKNEQDRARDEVTELLNRTGQNLKLSDLQELDYLERCIKESLRLLPPVSTILRFTEEELQLKNALIPENIDIILHFFDLHRDPKYWNDPEKFDPDRFLPENCVGRHPFAYVPFSAGPRNCIGQKFAMMELKSIIARVLYDFYLEPIDSSKDLKLSADIVIRPTHPIHTKFVRINK